MKTIVILMISCLLFTSCYKKNSSGGEVQSEINQELPSQEIVGQEALKPDISYVVNIDSFKFLEEFPGSIADVKARYPNEQFEEEIFENDVKGLMGRYVYALRCPNIRFGFWGDSTEDAILLTVEIFNPDYQCESMQVIGMSTEELERMSGKKLNADKRIIIATELYVLSIKTADGIVQSYSIISQL